MFKRLRFPIIFVVAVFFGGVLLSAGASADTGTIELKSGERLEKVNYTVDYDFKVIKLQLPGGDRNLSFLDIKKILDPSGKDITTSVLEPGSDQSWPPEEFGEPDGRKAKLWDFAARVAVNYSIPAGTYYQGLNPGIGFEGDVSVPVSKETAVRFSVSRSGVHYGNTGAFAATRMVMSIQSFAPMDWYFPRKGLTYLYGGVGIVRHTSSYGSFGSDATRPMVEGGGGGVTFFDRETGVGFDYSGAVGFVFGSQGSGAGLFFDLKLGLCLWIPHK